MTSLIEWVGVDDPARLPAKQAALVTEKDDCKGKGAKLKTMGGRGVRAYLITNSTSRMG